ncbi:MAG: glucuronate isomerase [Bacteroidota bacterium]
MNKAFIHDDFLLQTKAARKLYHEYARDLPIIDYHCHLDPKQIAEDIKWENLTQLSLDGDHYKWRAMRANGVEEKYISGNSSDWEKFRHWAHTLPFTLRNPLYHWTQLELKRFFGINTLLNENSAKEIFDKTAALLQNDEYSAKNMLIKSKVEVLCTTDDPTDTLEHHQAIRDHMTELKVLPGWRPDKLMSVEDPEQFNQYLNKLEEVSDTEVNSVKNLMEAVNKRHDYFSEMGCRLSDHGIEEFYAEDYTETEIEKIFINVRSGNQLAENDIRKFKSFMLFEFALMDHEKGWVQQYHFGAIRNNNSRMFQQLGPDSGFDSMGDHKLAVSLSAFMNRLDKTNQLTKTIIYTINPKDNDTIATMAGNFQDGTFPGKIQFGPAWWFLDQKQGMEAQMNALSNHGLLSRFVGMLTDSRSFLSFSRHEYFRRILCNMLGDDLEKGLIPDDIEMIGEMVQNICYYNARNYFKFSL